MRFNIIIALLVSWILSGCVGLPDQEGWSSKQKEAFLEILKTDKYASICNEAVLAQEVKQSKDSMLMSKMLIAYTQNLANGCIENPQLKTEKGSVSYGIYTQEVDSSDIKRKLRAGQSIEKILSPYIPQYRQFDALIAQYNLRISDKNTPASLLHAIRLNIERVKLMKPNIGDTYVLVNIPEYQIRVIEEDKTSVKMRVIVGKRKNRTPIFCENLSYITVNPTWNVPDSIARNEIIPHTLKNPNYLKKHRLVMRRDYDLNSPELFFNSVNASDYVGGRGYVPFKFIEVPSNRNALGRVKFIFPNHHSVYMHDTPTKYLFKRKKRAYSHGCIRLHKPKYMLEYISTHYTTHDYEDVLKKYNSYKTHYLKVVKPLPVHTAYLTTYVNQEGELFHFGDVYGYDKAQKLNF